jgi:hypothetical protein
MNHANTHTNNDTHAARSRHSQLSVFVVSAPTVWQVREEGEYYIPDLLEDEDFNANPALTEAASAHTCRLRDTQKLIEDTESLAGVLLDAVEQDGDTRAAQTRTILEFSVECLHKAHQLIDEQEGRDRNLFLAYFALKEETDEGGDEFGPPPLDD